MNPAWGVFDGDHYIDVAPIQKTGQIYGGHVVDTGSCWCGPRIEQAEDGRQIVIHSGREK